MDLGGKSEGSGEGVRRASRDGRKGGWVRPEERREKPEPCSSILSPSVLLLSVLPQGS